MAARFKKPPGIPRGRHYMKEWREHRRLTLDQMADALGTSKTTVWEVENGRPYSQDLLEEWARVVRCAPAQLLSGPPDKLDILRTWDAIMPDRREQALRVLTTFLP